MVDNKTDITVNSLENYIQEITKLNSTLNTNQNLYYRGQNDVFDNTLPSLFRNQNYLDNENNLINDFITKDPELFKNCQNNFDRLALMQHHQLPTRLLDITSNALVALYFAVEYKPKEVKKEENKTEINEHEEPDGRIFPFTNFPVTDSVTNYLNDSNLKNLIPDVTAIRTNNRQFLKSAFSDQVEIESSLARLNKDDKEQVVVQLDLFLTSINNEIEHFKTTVSKHLEIKPSMMYWYNAYADILNNDIKKRSEDILIDHYNFFNDDASIQRLYHEIRKDIGEFQPKIDPLEFLIPKIVVPRNIDQRIRNQNGLFMFVPFVSSSLITDNGSSQLKNNEYNNKVQKTIDILSLKDKINLEKKIVFNIPGNKKSEIRKELKNIGVTESFIYPDSSHIANEISHVYKDIK